MSDAAQEISGTRVLVLGTDGPVVHSGQDALDLLSAAYIDEPEWIAVPVERLVDEFFDLSTGIAGEIVQKYVNYRVGFAVLGDISRFTTASNALQALVEESNRGRHTWFLADLAELKDRLSTRRVTGQPRKPNRDVPAGTSTSVASAGREGAAVDVDDLTGDVPGAG